MINALQLRLIGTLFLQNNLLKSVTVYGRAGKHAHIAATLNIANVACHPYADSTGPVKSCPKMLPKPEIPSLTPLIVAKAF